MDRGMPAPRGERGLHGAWLTAALATVAYAYLVLPSLLVIPISLGSRTELVFPPTTLTLDLYRDYFASPEWIAVTVRSVRNAVLAAALAVLVGVPGAYALARLEFFGKPVLVALLLSPIVVPVIVVSLGLYLYFARIGLVGTTPGLVLAHAMYVTPFVIITVSAGLKQLDERLETAATIMGAGRLRVFARVVLPQLTPSIVAAALFAFLMSFDEVVIAWFITGPSSMTLPVKMYSSIKWESSPVLAAVATILMAASLLVCLVAAAATRRRSRD